MSQQQNRFARHKVLTGTGAGTCALVAVITLGGVAGGGHNGDGENGGTDTKASSADGGSGTTSKASGQKAQEAKEERAEEKKAAFSGSGTLEVGTDVKPGTYRTTGDSDGMCYWERAKNSSGEPEAILANDNVTGSTPAT